VVIIIYIFILVLFLTLNIIFFSSFSEFGELDLATNLVHREGCLLLFPKVLHKSKGTKLSFFPIFPTCIPECDNLGTFQFNFGKAGLGLEVSKSVYVVSVKLYCSSIYHLLKGNIFALNSLYIRDVCDVHKYIYC
jgi:hypothetical protein